MPSYCNVMCWAHILKMSSLLHTTLSLSTHLQAKNVCIGCGLNPQSRKSSCYSLPQSEAELASAFTFLSMSLQVDID